MPSLSDDLAEPTGDYFDAIAATQVRRAILLAIQQTTSGMTADRDHG